MTTIQPTRCSYYVSFTCEDYWAIIKDIETFQNFSNNSRQGFDPVNTSEVKDKLQKAVNCLTDCSFCGPYEGCDSSTKAEWHIIGVMEAIREGIKTMNSDEINDLKQTVISICQRYSSKIIAAGINYKVNNYEEGSIQDYDACVKFLEKYPL